MNDPMPEEFPGKEDRFWAEKIINNGEKILYTPEFSVNHFFTSNGATWKGIG